VHVNTHTPFNGSQTLGKEVGQSGVALVRSAVSQDEKKVTGGCVALVLLC